MQNKNTLALAEKIRFEREQEFLMHREGYRLKKDRSVNFLDYFQKYLDNYTKSDVASMKTALTKLAVDKYAAKVHKLRMGHPFAPPSKSLYH